LGALKDEVTMLSGVIRERDEALSNASREIKVLRVIVRGKDETLQALERTCGGLRDEAMGWQTHSKGELLAMQWSLCRGSRLALT
jgi:hypothetical protein